VLLTPAPLRSAVVNVHGKLERSIESTLEERKDQIFMSIAREDGEFSSIFIRFCPIGFIFCP
jgi:hypothetical protein